MNPSFHVEGVNNMNDVLEQRLTAKKRDLENQQEYFKIDIKNIEQSNYEDNAINALLNMKKLKTEILKHLSSACLIQNAGMKLEF